MNHVLHISVHVLFSPVYLVHFGGSHSPVLPSLDNCTISETVNVNIVSVFFNCVWTQ